MGSNVENILQTMVDQIPYENAPQSRVEDLLLQVKNTYESGGGGGGESIIDDTAIATNKVWSSHKTDNIITELNNKIIGGGDYIAISSFNDLKNAIKAKVSEMIPYSIENMVIACSATFSQLPLGGNYGVQIYKGENDNYISSIIQGYHTGDIKSLNYYNGTWTFRDVAFQQDILSYKYNDSNIISSNTDLNNITVPGVYFCQTSAICDTLSNLPEIMFPISNSFVMSVYQINSQNIVQEISTDDSNYRFQRAKKSNTWSKWYCLVSMDDITPMLNWRGGGNYTPTTTTQYIMISGGTVHDWLIAYGVKNNSQVYGGGTAIIPNKVSENVCCLPVYSQNTNTIKCIISFWVSSRDTIAYSAGAIASGVTPQIKIYYR